MAAVVAVVAQMFYLVMELLITGILVDREEPDNMIPPVVAVADLLHIAPQYQVRPVELETDQLVHHHKVVQADFPVVVAAGHLTMVLV
jgi:hypothetical protein